MGESIDVINMSLGGGDNSAIYARAIAEAMNEVIVVVALAENNGINNDLLPQ